MSEQRKVPKLRFPEFTDDWEQHKLNEITSRVQGNNGRLNLQTLTISAGNGWMKQEDRFSANIAGKEQKNYTLLKQGELAYNHGNSKLAKYGAVFELKDFDEALVPRVYHSFRVNNKTNSSFIEYLFATKILDKELGKLVSSGARMDGLLNIGYEDFVSIKITVPSFEEQQKIASYFRKVDEIITLHQRKYDSLVNVKKAMFEKLFPKNGETVPEIRFKGFTDTWEQRKLGELAEYKKGPFGSAITKDMFVPKSDDSVKVYEQQNAIEKDWSLERYFLPKEYVLTKLKSFKVIGGDIIVSCAGTIGEIYEIPENAECGVINQALMRIRVKEDIIDKRMFIIAFSNMIDEFTRTRSNGSAIKNIPPFADLKPMEVLMPSIREQRKITGYFESLDHLITLHQRRLEKLKNIKKSCLEKMFV